ncbi:MAG: hypothetical protein NVS4B8_14950 [Herpetosiphon sp.]
MAVKTKTPPRQVRPGLRRWLVGTVRSGKLFALVLTVAAGMLGYVALTSPRFTIHVVEAAGTRALTPADVTRAASITGMPIWFVHADDVQRRIAESPYVETVGVRLRLPDAAIVTIRERQPDIRWLHDGQVFAVTADGLIVDQVVPPSVAPGSAVTATVALSRSTVLSATAALTATAAPRPRSVGVVTVVDTTPNRPVKVRDHVDPDALELARRIGLRTADLGRPLTRIEWDAGLGLSLIIGEGHQVVFGNSHEFDRKWATLRYILKDGTPYKFLDLRPNTPYYR